MRPAAALVVFAALVFAVEAARVTSQGSANAAAAAAASTTSTSTTTSKAGNFNAGLFDNIQVIDYDISWAADYNLGYTGRDVTAGDATIKDNDSGYPSCQTTAGGAPFLSGQDYYKTGRGRRLSETCSPAPAGYISIPSSTVSANEAIAEFELDATTTICGFTLGAEAGVATHLADLRPEVPQQSLEKFDEEWRQLEDEHNDLLALLAQQELEKTAMAEIEANPKAGDVPGAPGRLN